MQTRKEFRAIAEKKLTKQRRYVKLNGDRLDI